jgi:hypothetical protein
MKKYLNQHHPLGGLTGALARGLTAGSASETTWAFRSYGVGFGGFGERTTSSKAKEIPKVKAKSRMFTPKMEGTKQHIPKEFFLSQKRKDQKSLLFYNQILDKKGTKKILSWFLDNYGPTRTSQFIEQLKSVGFHFATEAGLSLGFDDLKIPEKKSILLNTAESDVLECEKKFFQGKITAVERYQKLIDIWTTTSENLKDEVIQNFQDTDLLNPLYMMAFSGARGNISQVRQLVGMRGLMSDSAGGIIDFPIRSNFREGLTVTEYAISCYGARKGLIDTALRTADSGYLTRRLVDVAHGIMIGRSECTTKENFEISPLKANGKSGSEAILLSLEKRIIGRVLAEDILGAFPETGSSTSGESYGKKTSRIPIARKNQEISPSLAQKIVQYKKETLQVRSPLTCLHFQNLREDICQLCYGWSLAHGRLVSIGEAVGILAAQSIGEPGTQLTMRTFHTGGIFSTDIEAKIFAPHEGFVSFSKKVKGRKVRTFHGETAFFTFEPIQLKIQKNLGNDFGGISGAELMNSTEQSKADVKSHIKKTSYEDSFSIFRLPSQSLIFVYPGQFIRKNLLLAEVSQLMSAKKSSKTLSEKREQEEALLGRSSRLQNENGQSAVRSRKTRSNSKQESRSTPSSLPSLPSLPSLEDSSSSEGEEDSSSQEIPKVKESERPSPFFPVSNGHKIAQGRSGSALKDAQNFPEKDVPSFSEEENDLEKEEENKPNSKRVLSEIEGQIYFHRLAERRQITEFEKVSHVKGVGSLWVLAGKKVFAPGPFQSGDFVTKSRKPTGTKIAFQHEALLRLRPSGVTAWEKSKFNLENSSPSPSDEDESSKEGKEGKEWSTFDKENEVFSSTLLGPRLVIPKGITSALKRERSQNRKIFFKRNVMNSNAFSEMDLKKDVVLYGIQKSISYYELPVKKWNFALEIPQNGASELNRGFSPLSRKQSPLQCNWVKKQAETAYPGMSILAFTKASSFNNRLRRSSKIIPTFENNDFVAQSHFLGFRDLLPSGSSLPSLQDSLPRKVILQYPEGKSRQGEEDEALQKQSLGKGSKYPYLWNLRAAVKASSTAASLSLFPGILKIFTFAESGFFSDISNYVFSERASGRLEVSNRKFKSSEVESFRDFTSLKSEFKISGLEFHHGELRFLSGGLSQKNKKGKHNLGETGKAGSQPLFNETESSSQVISMKSFGDSNLLGKTNQELQEETPSASPKFDNESISAKKTVKEEGLNLRTFDLRFYKKSFSTGLGSEDVVLYAEEGKEYTKNSFPSLPSLQDSSEKLQYPEGNSRQGEGQRKIGELIRFGEEMEKNLSVDKTLQIIRRSRSFSSSLKTQEEEKRKSNKKGFYSYTFRRVHPYLISNHSPLAVSHGDIVETRQFLFELFYQQSKTGDIVQGLPKIEQLFEARRTSLHVIETVHVRLKEKFQQLSSKYPLYEAARLSIRFIQRVLIDEIQLVYQSQGVDIADKHLEIIIRQMTSKVIIHEKGKSPFFPDDIIDFHQIGQFEIEFRKSLQSQNSSFDSRVSPSLSSFSEISHQQISGANLPSSKQMFSGLTTVSSSSSGIVFEPIVLGLTKIAFLTQSFISAASFQETKRVLMNSALQSRVDFLYGLKENVIVGRFIRAGTGFRTSLFPSA